MRILEKNGQKVLKSDWDSIQFRYLLDVPVEVVEKALEIAANRLPLD